MIANYHTHTTRCGHASGSEREYIENAIRAGFLELGFSDHAPMPFDGGYISGIRMSIKQTEDYVSTLLDLRREYEKDIKVLIGFETEYYPRYFERFLEYMSQYPIDYLIMGQHFNGNEHEGMGYYGSATKSEEMLCAYVDQVIEGLSTGKFSYLAHPDVINFVGDDEIYRREMSRLINYTNEQGIPLEINLLGIVGNRFYPRPLFWSIANQLSATAIIGCDAHEPGGIIYPGTLEKAEKLLQENSNLKLIDKLELKPLK